MRFLRFFDVFGFSPGVGEPTPGENHGGAARCSRPALSSISLIFRLRAARGRGVLYTIFAVCVSGTVRFVRGRGVNGQ
jgi:hypothetical protein